jgi:hypothetical protein
MPAASRQAPCIGQTSQQPAHLGNDTNVPKNSPAAVATGPSPRGMATDPDGDGDGSLASPSDTIHAPSTPSRARAVSVDTEDDEDDDEGQDEEPKLKYSRLTGSLGAVYRSGDSSSAFLVAGDKMVRSCRAIQAQSFRKL